MQEMKEIKVRERKRMKQEWFAKTKKNKMRKEKKERAIEE